MIINKNADGDVNPKAVSVKDVAADIKPVQDSIPEVPAAKKLTAEETMQQLLKIQLERENREQAESEEKRQASSRKAEQRSRAAKVDIKSTLDRQMNCNHLKGGRSHDARQKIDYNLSWHKFCTGIEVIKCLTCRMKWQFNPATKVGDTREFLFRGEDGKKKIPNHTRISWADAYNMAKNQSSNTRSTSEQVIKQDAPLDADGNPLITPENPQYEYEI